MTSGAGPGASRAGRGRAPVPTPAAPEPGPAHDPDGRLRLLLVDDVEIERLMVRRTLARTTLAGAEVHEAEDAPHALALLEAKGEFDCVLLDYELATDTGLDVLRRVSAERDVPVIMLTGRSDPATVATLMKAGAVDLLTKDAVTPERLEQAIRSAVRVARAERAAAAHRALLETTLRSIADAVLVMEARGTVSYMNPAAERLTGWPAREALGRRLEEVVFVVAADARGRPLRENLLHERATRVLAGHESDERADMTLVARDGTQLYVDATVTPLRSAGTAPGQAATGVVIALRDITARLRATEALADANVELRRQAETLEQQAVEMEQQVEEARMLTEELAETNERLLDEERRTEESRREETELVETLRRIGGVLSSELDVERLVQIVTDAATALTGAKFGAFFYNVVDKQGAQLTLYTLSGAPRSAFEHFGHPRPTPVFAPTFYGEGIVRSDDITKDPRYGQMPPHHGMPKGHLPVVSYLAVPVISRSGEVIGGLFFGHEKPGVFTERSERLAAGIASSAAVAMDNARLYDAERRARGDAEAANRAKSEFLANMSHELRTPLNAIGGYASLVLEGIRGPVTDAQRGDLERIKRSQHHLLSLINDILNFAKMEAGRVRFDVTDVVMDAALAELEVLIAPQLHEKALRYAYRGCSSGLAARVDAERLQQILLNLLSNAVKFTPAGGEIRVECDTPGEAGETVVVRVTDTGVGIPADKREQIFEPFVQLERGQTPQNAGTGLGLAISRDLARAMGGELTVESTLDVGSTFTLTLPRSR